jgi:hypothetical protein
MGSRTPLALGTRRDYPALGKALTACKTDMLRPGTLPNLAVLDQGCGGAQRRRSRPLRHALQACGVGAGPSGRAGRAAR